MASLDCCEHRLCPRCVLGPGWSAAWCEDGGHFTPPGAADLAMAESGLFAAAVVAAGGAGAEPAAWCAAVHQNHLRRAKRYMSVYKLCTSRARSGE